MVQFINHISQIIKYKEIIPRCLAAAIRCVTDGNDQRAKLAMKARFREIAREVSRWQLSGEAKAKQFVRPLEEELVNRFGSLIGRRLYWEFFDAFWLLSLTNEDLVHAKTERSIAIRMNRKT